MSDLPGRPPRSREQTRALWTERLARFPQAGLTVAAFCAAEGISLNSFFYWKKRLDPRTAEPADTDPPRLIPIRLQPSSPVEIVLPSGAILRLGPGCDLAFVRSLLAALGCQPC